MALFKRRGAHATDSAERADRMEAALSDAAREAADVARSANVVSESIRFRLDSPSTPAEAHGAPGHRVGELAHALAEAAAELNRRAGRLSRALEDEPLPPLDLRGGQRHALRRISPPDAVEAEQADAGSGDDTVSDGLRVLVTKMLSDGWTGDEAAYYLWSELGISDSHAVVATVVKRASTLSDKVPVA